MLHTPIRLEDRLRSLAEQWAAAHEPPATLARLGRRVVNDTSFFSRLESPAASTTTATLEKFAQFLADPASWPGGEVAAEAKAFAHVVGVSPDAAAGSAGKSEGNSPRPIAAAPRDGKVIAVADDSGNRAQAFWTRACSGEGWFTIDATRDPPLQPLGFEPTKWSEAGQDLAA